jgi:predicted small secreted protein
MDSKLLFIAIACDAITGCNTLRGAGQDVRAGEQKVERAFSRSDFDKADKDRDGTLDRTEAAGMPDVSRNFDAMDRDRDGTVSVDEIHNYTAEHRQ